MELFDTHFVWFGQVLVALGMKLAVNWYVQVVKSQPHLQNKNNTSDYECTHQMELFWYLVWSSIACFRDKIDSSK